MFLGWQNKQSAILVETQDLDSPKPESLILCNDCAKRLPGGCGAYPSVRTLAAYSGSYWSSYLRFVSATVFELGPIRSFAGQSRNGKFRPGAAPWHRGINHGAPALGHEGGGAETRRSYYASEFWAFAVAVRRTLQVRRGAYPHRTSHPRSARHRLDRNTGPALKDSL
jgi:hypothetical protein